MITMMRQKPSDGLNGPMVSYKINRKFFPNQKSYLKQTPFIKKK